MRIRRIALVLVLATSLGCGARAAPSLANRADDGIVLAYDAAAFAGRWEVVSQFASRPGAEVALDAGATIAMRLEPAGPTTLDLFVELMLVKGNIAGQAIDQRISADDPAVAAAFATPLSSISMDAQGAVTGTPNPDNALAQMGVHLIDTAIFLIPPTPTGPIEVGAEWTASRVVPTSQNVPDVAAEIRYRLASLEACPTSPTDRCATITSVADTGDRTMLVDGRPTRLRYRLEGESEVQIGGALSASSARMTMSVQTPDLTLELDGTMSYQRVAASAP